MIRRRGNQWPTFPADTMRRMFDAVDVNDVIDAHAPLPDAIVLGCPEDSIRQSYALCLQFWKDGFTRTDALRLVDKLLRNEGLSADERLEFKHIRARYKHLRFAQRLYSKRHTSDYLFDKTTRILGKLQDAFRGGQRDDMVRSALRLRVLLSKPVWSMVQRSLENTQLDSEAGVVAFQKEEIRGLKKAMASTSFAGHEFHTVRKIVSMQVCFYDTLRTLGPNDHAYRMSRSLAAINGLMGSRHDEIIAEALSGRRHYDTPAPLANETRSRLETLIARYPI